MFLSSNERQTLRTGLAAIDKYRQASTSVFLHTETGRSDVAGDLTHCLHLARSSVTASFTEGISAAGVGTAVPERVDGVTDTRRDGTLPMISHELAALQLVRHAYKTRTLGDASLNPFGDGFQFLY